MQAAAIVSSKGQVTLPAAMRAYRGILKKYNLNPADLEIEKEPDRIFE